jgi:hypothetical protein
MKLNLNDNVKVRLNDRGREILAGDTAKVRELFPRYSRRLEEDEQGWSTWQLWHLMEMFGPHMQLGVETPFDPEIEIEDHV